jgi:hypothetical protein
MAEAYFSNSFMGLTFAGHCTIIGAINQSKFGREEMKNRTKALVRAFLPIFVFFLIVCFLIMTIPSVLQEWNVDHRVLLGGNEILFIVTAISYWLHVRSLRNSNPHVFVRMVYGSLLVKMLVCCVAVVLYAWRNHAVSKNAIIGCFMLYIIYTFMEVRVLTQLTKKLPKNA